MTPMNTTHQNHTQDQRRKQKQILFLGTHGQYNIGDELLLETFLAQLGQDNRYAVNSYDPPFTQGMMQPKFDVTAFHTTKQLPRFLGYLLSSDLVFFGGGSIIKELYASVGRNPYSTLRMILGTVLFAKRIAGKPIIMSNIGVGPITTPTGERLAKTILDQVDFLSVRDDKSLNTCLRLGLSPQKVRRVPDAVFANPCEALLTMPPIVPDRTDKRLHVALNLNYDIENRGAWEGFLSNLAVALQRWNDETPLAIHALPMQSRFKANDDLTILTAFRERIPNIPMTLHNPQTAQEAAAIIAGCDMVLAERLHTLVISAILGKPFFGLMYDVKVKELIGYLGMLDHAIDINEPFAAGELFAGLRVVQAQREDLSRFVSRRAATLRSELDRYFTDVRQHAHLA